MREVTALPSGRAGLVSQVSRRPRWWLTTADLAAMAGLPTAGLPTVESSVDRQVSRTWSEGPHQGAESLTLLAARLSQLPR